MNLKRTCYAIGVVLLALILLTSSQAMAQRKEPAQPAWSVASNRTLTGGSYSLENLSWKVSGRLSGEGFRLESPEDPDLTGSGCCCTYLPCVFNSPP
jgi:hypothetical protein